MTPLIVTAVAEVDGQVVTGQAVAQVRGRPPHHHHHGGEGATRWLVSLAEVVEHHVAAFRRDLERLLDREDRDGFEWFRREDGGEGSGM